MTGGSRTSDGAMVDEQWRGYDLRAALPLVILAVLLSIALLAGRWVFDDFIDGLVPYLIVLGIWPALLGLALYRAITYTYHLTDKALLVDFGPLHRPVPPVWFPELANVESGANWLHSRLGIGWVRITGGDGRTVRLPAVRDAAAFAALLQSRRLAAKQPGSM